MDQFKEYNVLLSQALDNNDPILRHKPITPVRKPSNSSTHERPKQDMLAAAPKAKKSLSRSTGNIRDDNSNG